jgi:hypothetical protein
LAKLILVNEIFFVAFLFVQAYTEVGRAYETHNHMVVGSGEWLDARGHCFCGMRGDGDALLRSTSQHDLP